MRDMLPSLRYAFRSLRRNPGFTSTSVFTLALGIAASSLNYCVVRSTLLRTLPFADSDRVVALWEHHRLLGKQEIAAPDFRDWLHHPRLVIREHGRDESRPWIGGEKAVQHVELDDPVAVDRYPFGLGNRTKNRIVLDRGDEYAIAPSTQERKMVRFGAAADKNNPFGRRFDQRSDHMAGALHRPSRGASPVVD